MNNWSDAGAGGAAGADGCPDGWLVTIIRGEEPSSAELRFVPHIARLFADARAPAVLAIDIPIGLPGRAVGSGRACEIEARRRLGARQSSVFSIPARAAVMQEDYRAACDAALATSDPPRKVSKQAFNLFPKIREVDALLRSVPAHRDRIYECHPELVFWAMRGGSPAEHPKKIRSRPNPAGLEERRHYLEEQGFPPSLLRPAGRLPGRAGPDDVLDSAAAAWTALRIRRNKALCLPARPPRDEHGLTMAIWA